MKSRAILALCCGIAMLFLHYGKQPQPVRNDCAEAGLHGRVRQMSSINYPRATSSHGSIRPDLHSIYQFRQIFEFNKAGNRTSERSTGILAGRETGPSAVYYEYDGHRKTGARLSVQQDHITGYRVIQWLSEYTYVRMDYSYDNGKCYNWDTTVLDNAYRIKMVTYGSRSPDDSNTPCKTVSYRYDTNNQLRLLIRSDCAQAGVSDSIWLVPKNLISRAIRPKSSPSTDQIRIPACL